MGRIVQSFLALVFGISVGVARGEPKDKLDATPGE